MTNDNETYEGGGNGVELVHPATQQRPTTQREEFGSLELTTTGELNTASLMAQAKAAIESRYKMALARPRRPDDVRQRILGECRRPKFADEAIYSVPRGRIKDPRTGEWVDNYVEGPSIRFVETALRNMGNTYTKVLITHEDDRKVIVNVSVTDLESNTTYDTDLTIPKTMERATLRQGQSAIGMRTNSAGKRVYVVEAPEGEMLMKQNALVSKAIRTLGLRIIDGDVVAEAMELCNRILADRTAADPDLARKQVADAFATMRVMPSDLEVYLGCQLDKATPAQVDGLRKLYASLRDGQVAWQDVIEGRVKPTAPAPAPAATVPRGAPSSAPSSSAAPAAAPRAPAPAAAPAAEATPPPRQPDPVPPVSVDQAGADGTWQPPPPPDEPETKAEVKGSLETSIDAARQREAERGEKPKRGTAAAKAELARKKAQAPAPAGAGLFDGPPPGDDDLPKWAGGKAPDPATPPVDPKTGKPQAF